MTDKVQKEVLRIIGQIEKRLDSLEELMGWLIKASSRFKKGQRVKFSAQADRHGISRTKHGVQRGTITKVSDNFSVEVLLDGYKGPHSYHHSFFDSIR